MGNPYESLAQAGPEEASGRLQDELDEARAALAARTASLELARAVAREAEEVRDAQTLELERLRAELAREKRSAEDYRAAAERGLAALRAQQAHERAGRALQLALPPEPEPEPVAPAAPEPRRRKAARSATPMPGQGDLWAE